MGYQIASEIVLALHFMFILFVVFGGLLVLWRPRVMWIHLPLMAWGTIVNLAGWACPLTPLEKWFREHAGGTGYEGGFIEHYLTSLIYPGGMTRSIALVAGISLPAWNILVYLWIWYRLSRRGAG